MGVTQKGGGRPQRPPPQLYPSFTEGMRREGWKEAVIIGDREEEKKGEGEKETKEKWGGRERKMREGFPLFDLSPTLFTSPQDVLDSTPMSFRPNMSVL